MHEQSWSPLRPPASQLTYHGSLSQKSSVQHEHPCAYVLGTGVKTKKQSTVKMEVNFLMLTSVLLTRKILRYSDARLQNSKRGLSLRAQDRQIGGATKGSRWQSFRAELKVKTAITCPTSLRTILGQAKQIFVALLACGYASATNILIIRRCQEENGKNRKIRPPASLSPSRTNHGLAARCMMWAWRGTLMRFLRRGGPAHYGWSFLINVHCGVEDCAWWYCPDVTPVLPGDV